LDIPKVIILDKFAVLIKGDDDAQGPFHRGADHVRFEAGGIRKAGWEVCRQLGVSEQSFYRWKRKYQGIGIAELRRLRQLEDENRKLKKIVADLSLDKHILQDVLSK
jgi:putative transposase